MGRGGAVGNGRGAGRERAIGGRGCNKAGDGIGGARENLVQSGPPENQICAAWGGGGWRGGPGGRRSPTCCHARGFPFVLRRPALCCGRQRRGIRRRLLGTRLGIPHRRQGRSAGVRAGGQQAMGRRARECMLRVQEGGWARQLTGRPAVPPPASRQLPCQQLPRSPPSFRAAARTCAAPGRSLHSAAGCAPGPPPTGLPRGQTPPACTTTPSSAPHPHISQHRRPASPHHHDCMCRG